MSESFIVSPPCASGGSERSPRRGSASVAPPNNGGQETSDRPVRSALLRRLRHETRELREGLRGVGGGKLRLALLPVGDGHDQFERLLALLADELVARHCCSLHAEKLGRRPGDRGGCRAPSCLPGRAVLGADRRR